MIANATYREYGRSLIRVERARSIACSTCVRTGAAAQKRVGPGARADRRRAARNSLVDKVDSRCRREELARKDARLVAFKLSLEGCSI